jgi:hypothetical protein
MSDRNFAESHKVVNCTTKSSDILSGNLQSDIYNMEDWRDSIFVLTLTSSDGTATARCHLRSVSAVSGGTTHGMPFYYRLATGTSASDTLSAWTLATSSGFITTAGANQIYELWGKSRDLYDGDSFIMWDSTEIVNDPAGGALTACFFNGRYHEDSTRSILA